MNQAFDNQAGENLEPISRPGVSSSFLLSQGVKKVSLTKAKILTGCSTPGLYIPYYDLNGKPIEDGENEFGRLRLSQPIGDKKYHQRKNSKQHAYIPLLNQWSEFNWVILVEGEFKALSLCEAGYPAIGLPGLYATSENKLLPEIEEFVSEYKPAKIYYLGDSDTFTNWQFSNAVLKIRERFDSEILLPRIPLDSPDKGIDDCRELLGEDFDQWFQSILSESIEVTNDFTDSDLALTLFDREVPILEKMDRVPRRKYIKKAYKNLLPQLETFELAEIRKIFKKNRFSTNAEFDELLNKTLNEQKEKFKDYDVPTIDKSQPSGDWTREILEIMSDDVFLYSDILCTHEDEKMIPINPAQITTKFDQKSKCRIVKKNNKGEYETPLTEPDGRLIIGAVRNCKSILRIVEMMSKIPLLVEESGSPKILNEGYNESHKTLVCRSDNIADLSAEEAVRSLLNVIRDFKPETKNDLARLIAAILTPALSLGGLIGQGRSPIFYIEKDKHGTGGGMLTKLIFLIYGEKPEAVVESEKSDRLMEGISQKVRNGRNLLFLDNIRGDILKNSPKLESITTEPIMEIRVPYYQGNASMVRRVFYIVTNGAQLSPDLASRCVKIKILHRGKDFKYNQWSEGGLLEHVEANNIKYLSAIYALIKIWISEGRPSGKTTNFRFPQWEKAMSWIIERFFDDLTLMDSEHDKRVIDMVDQDFDLLKNLFRCATTHTKSVTLSPSSIAGIGIENDLIDEGDLTKIQMRVGRMLSKRFSYDGCFEFGNGEFAIVRTSDVNPNDKNKTLKKYTITRRAD